MALREYKREYKRKLEEHRPHGLDGVGEDDFFVGLSLRVGVAAVVNELHLLENGGFSRLSGTCMYQRTPFRQLTNVLTQSRILIPESSRFIPNCIRV